MQVARPDSDGEVGAFRRFNRKYTRFLGTLNNELLETEYSLAEGRILYEMATRSALLTAGDIAQTLGLDAGYLSRLLAKLERGGLLKRKISKHDGRSAELSLTSRGRAAFEMLNTRSDEQAHTVLDGLAPSARGEVIGSMQFIESSLMTLDASAPPFVLRPHRIGDMGWVVHREAIGYAEQFGWGEQFEALVAKIVEEFLRNFDPSKEHCWIAESNGEPVGHIFLVKHPNEPETAKLRLLFVEPSARGLGVGEMLVRECVAFARAAGYRQVMLWTHSILTAAHRIYKKTGFRLIKEEPHCSFGHDLIGQKWELDLRCG